MQHPDKIPKSECPEIWIRLPKHKRSKSWSSVEGPVVLLERNLYGHPLAGLLWERQCEKVLLEHGWELGIGNAYSLFISVYVDDIKTGWKDTKHCSNVESIDETNRFGPTNIIP